MLFCKSTTISQSQETKGHIHGQTNLAAASGTRQKVPEVAAVRLPWLHVVRGLEGFGTRSWEYCYNFQKGKPSEWYSQAFEYKAKAA